MFSRLDCVAHVYDALLDMVADESYQVPSEANDACLKTARAMLTELKSPSLGDTRVFAGWLIEKLESIVDKSFTQATSSVNKEKLWTEFYQLQTSVLFREKWKSYLCLLKLPQKVIFFQSYTSILFDNIIKMKFPVDKASEARAQPSSYEEENAIRYVGGYVVAALKKRSTDMELLAGLDHLIEKDQEKIRSSESAVWVKAIDRGGLTYISEEAQEVFLSIEACTKANFTFNVACKLDDNTRHWLKNDIFADGDVQFHWCLTGITLKVDEEKAEELLELCIDQWITVREKAFANSIFEFYKQQTKKGTKAKALRKTIE